jgi:selenocysteine lyase/cysteine desulfurase
VSTIDLSFNRSQFPAFAKPSLEGQSFFDNAGGSYACQDVIDNLNHFYRQKKCSHTELILHHAEAVKRWITRMRN